MNNEMEYLNYDALYEIAVTIFNYSNDIKLSLNKIDGYLKSINDDKVWKGQGRDSIINRYLTERENLNKLYLTLVDYSKSILELIQNREDLTKNVTNMIASMNESLLWPI